MGSCVSSPSPDTSSSLISFKLLFHSKTDNLIMPFPLKNSPPIASTFPDLGSKEDTFFYSKAWLDSDCDDDFLSVNGEFTPSRGNTPLHDNFTTGGPRMNKILVDDLFSGARPEPSPTDKKPRLSDLFKDSFGADDNVDKQYRSGSLMETPYASTLQSSERTPGFKCDNEKSLWSIQCCLPNLRSSFSERKKKMSPVHSVVR